MTRAYPSFLVPVLELQYVRPGRECTYVMSTNCDVRRRAHRAFCTPHRVRSGARCSSEFRVRAGPVRFCSARAAAGHVTWPARSASPLERGAGATGGRLWVSRIPLKRPGRMPGQAGPMDIDQVLPAHSAQDGCCPFPGASSPEQQLHRAELPDGVALLTCAPDPQSGRHSTALSS